jgi:peptidoglycan hydrolase CwlO-like protein
MSVSHHSNNGNNGNTETVLFDKLQGFSSSLRRERDDAYRQNQLAGERCRAVQEEWTALQKTVTDLQDKLGGLQEGEKLKGEIETTKQKTHALKQQVNTRRNRMLQRKVKYNRIGSIYSFDSQYHSQSHSHCTSQKG